MMCGNLVMTFLLRLNVIKMLLKCILLLKWISKKCSLL